MAKYAPHQTSVTGHEQTHEGLLVDVRRHLKHLIYSRTKARVSSESERLSLTPATTSSCLHCTEEFLASAEV